MKINQLETPCLLLDKTKVKRNIQRMEQKIESLGVTLRPHGKTAKNIDVLNMFRPEHRQKITVSTLKEAEYYFDNGITDIVYAVGISPNKLARVARLLNKGAKLTLLLDSEQQVEDCAGFAKANNVQFSLLIEIDCDGHRAGIKPSDPALISIASAIQNNETLHFSGVLTHAGGSYNANSVDDIVVMAEQERDAAVSAAEKLKAADIPCPVVSVGSTPTAMFAQDLTGVTEVRAGVFVFFDLVMAGLDVCQPEEIGISVLTSVIGKNTDKHWLLVDSGWMAMSRDRGTQGQKVDYAYGLVCGCQGDVHHNLRLTGTNQEHGIIDCSGEHEVLFEKTMAGDMLRILPNHACATAGMHHTYLVTDDGENTSESWQRFNGW